MSCWTAKFNWRRLVTHRLDYLLVFLQITMGCTLCYADPKSLTATGSYPTGALETYSPTLMVRAKLLIACLRLACAHCPVFSLHQIAVPKIWDTIKKGILGKVSAGSTLTQFLVKTAFEWRGFALQHGFDTPLFKALVFKKFSKAVGGKLRMGVSGGGPLNTSVQEFCRTAFGCHLVQGYVSHMYSGKLGCSQVRTLNYRSPNCFIVRV
jgi:long-chain acyl-CoA synthetase